MYYNVHIKDDRGNTHGWTIDRDSSGEALVRGDAMLAEQCPGRTRTYAEVTRATVGCNPIGPIQQYHGAGITR